jgi:hypothetical protein
MGTLEKRDSLIKFFSQIPKPNTNLRTDFLKLDNFKAIIRNEQSQFITKMEIKDGIGLNYPLTENIFVIITCVLN